MSQSSSLVLKWKDFLLLLSLSFCPPASVLLYCWQGQLEKLSATILGNDVQLQQIRSPRLPGKERECCVGVHEAHAGHLISIYFFVFFADSFVIAGSGVS